MNSKNLESTPLLHMYVPPRDVYAGGIELEQQSEEVLIVKESLWSRVAFLVLAATVGVFTAMFLYWNLQRIFIDDFSFTLKFWIVVGMASPGGIFSLGLTAKILLTKPIRLDRRRRILSCDGRLFGGWEHRLEELLAVQFCYGKSDVDYPEKGPRRITMQYQANLVFRDSNLTRRNVCEQKYLDRVERVAREVAKFLDVPLVNYVGPSGTMDAGDAEIRRLLDGG